MVQLMKVLKWLLISLGGLLGCSAIAVILYFNIFYYLEMNQIKKELNKIENVEVINIWGHKDITLEEISARIKIKGKGEIVLANLNSNDNNYPNRVCIYEIGGYSFTEFSWNGGIGSGIDIGNQGELGHLFECEFKTVNDVINDYDLIYKTITSLKMSPEINHIETEKYECYLFISNEKSIDQDPIFNLVGVYNLAEYARTLKWNRKDSYYNR
jgi:hypothetical protein